MKNFFFFFFLLAITSSGCFAPVNMCFDSSRMLDKGAFEIQGSASTYLSPYGGNINNNFGGKVGFGIGEKYNVKLRYEGILPGKSNFDFYASYLELDNKFKLGKNAAISLPFGYYFGINSVIFDPRIYFTHNVNDKFELSVIPKCHFYIGGSDPGIIPGISIGFGLSKDLKKWAIRPEFGYDFFFSAGISFSFNLNGKSATIKSQ